MRRSLGKFLTTTSRRRGPGAAAWSFASLLILVACSAADARADAPLEKQTEQFLPLQPGAAVKLVNIDGAIQVFAWREPRLRLATLRRAYTAARLQQLGLTTETRGNQVIIQTVMPEVHGLFADRSGTIDYTVTVPETTPLRLKLRTGEITLHDLRGGSAQIELGNGRLTAWNCFARVEAHAGTGTMQAFFPWWENLAAAFDYHIGYGRLDLRLPPEARFRIEAETADGGIHDEFGLPVRRETQRGQSLRGATEPDPPLSLGLHIRLGNISIDKLR